MLGEGRGVLLEHLLRVGEGTAQRSVALVQALHAKIKRGLDGVVLIAELLRQLHGPRNHVSDRTSIGFEASIFVLLALDRTSAQERQSVLWPSRRLPVVVILQQEVHLSYSLSLLAAWHLLLDNEVPDHLADELSSDSEVNTMEPIEHQNPHGRKRHHQQRADVLSRCQDLRKQLLPRPALSAPRCVEARLRSHLR